MSNDSSASLLQCAILAVPQVGLRVTLAEQSNGRMLLPNKVTQEIVDQDLYTSRTQPSRRGRFGALGLFRLVVFVANVFFLGGPRRL